MLNIDRPGLWVSSSTEHQGSKVFKGSLPNAISDRNSPGQLFGCAQKTAVDESSCDDLMETSYCTLFLQYLPSFDILCFLNLLLTCCTFCVPQCLCLDGRYEHDRITSPFVHAWNMKSKTNWPMLTRTFTWENHWRWYTYLEVSALQSPEVRRENCSLSFLCLCSLAE